MKLLKRFLNFLKYPHTCDNCGPCHWTKAMFVGYDMWRMKDGSVKFFCRDCSGYRSFLP